MNANGDSNALEELSDGELNEKIIRYSNLQPIRRGDVVRQDRKRCSEPTSKKMDFFGTSNSYGTLKSPSLLSGYLSTHYCTKNKAFGSEFYTLMGILIGHIPPSSLNQPRTSGNFTSMADNRILFPLYNNNSELPSVTSIFK